MPIYEVFFIQSHPTYIQVYPRQFIPCERQWKARQRTKAGWSGFLRHLKQRGLKSPKLIISDACLGLIESIEEFFPESKWQRCIVHYYRNVFSVVPRRKMGEVSRMLKAIHASEDRQAALEKAEAVRTKLEKMRLREAAKKIKDSIAETPTHYGFPSAHWQRIMTNNPLERIMKEIRRRTRVFGAFLDGNSALMLMAARLRHIAGTKWGSKMYISIRAQKKGDVPI